MSVEKAALSVIQRLTDSGQKELANDLVRMLHLWRSERIDDEVLRTKTILLMKKWAQRLDAPK